MDDLDSLRRSIQALCATGQEQLLLFPEFVCCADELALDFESAHLGLSESTKAQFTAEQTHALLTFDRRLEEKSGPANAEFWTTEALLRDPDWQGIRQLAARVRDAFGWPAEMPERNGATYVSEHRT